ncbi:CYP-14A4 protein [Aphelenchoides avenae]|nr:CYP-14A4 protein [Aphelenchus avenae]
MLDKIALPYFSAVVNEILRHGNGSIFEPHLSTSDQTICGRFIPANTRVIPQFNSVQLMDPAFEEPHEFKPERFLESDEKTMNRATTSRVVAFGMGRRLCPGEALARMQIFLVLAFLLQRYEFIANGPLIAKPSKPQMFLREPEEYTCNIKVRPAANQ